MIIVRNFEDEYYEDEKLYSTGDDYLDEMLEKAFCEGYEYAQREFNNISDLIVKISGLNDTKYHTYTYEPEKLGEKLRKNYPRIKKRVLGIVKKM
jgi:flagellar motor switch protein FliG